MLGIKWRCFTRESTIRKKTATIQRFEYLPLDNELKKQTDIVGKQDQVLWIWRKGRGWKDNDKTLTIEKQNKSDLICNSKHSLYKYRYI